MQPYADPVTESVPERSGAPIGRRVFLSLLGLGAAGVVAGARVQDWLGNALASIEAKDPTGLSALLPFGQFRFYTVTGSFPSPARRLPAARDGAGRRAFHDLVRGARGDAAYEDHA